MVCQSSRRRHRPRRPRIESALWHRAGPAEEVANHVAVDLVILQTPVNWFGAPWIYKKYVDEVFNLGLATKELLAGDVVAAADVPSAVMI